jgi:hypothetical protein
LNKEQMNHQSDMVPGYDPPYLFISSNSPLPSPPAHHDGH